MPEPDPHVPKQSLHPPTETLTRALGVLFAELLRDPSVTEALRTGFGSMGPADTLVPLAEAEIETKAARGLQRRGLLRIVRIGRRAYLKRSELLRAFDALAEEQQAQPETDTPPTPAAGYAAVVELARAKRRGSLR